MHLISLFRYSAIRLIYGAWRKLRNAEKTLRDKTYLPPKIFDNSHTDQDLLQYLDPLLGPHHAALPVLWFLQREAHYATGQTITSA